MSTEAPRLTSAQQRARYSGIEGRIRLLFGNCAELWTNYETKHQELVEVFDFLKILAGNLGDISQSIKKGEKCDNIVDDILDDLDALIRVRQQKDAEEQTRLRTLKEAQRTIMTEVNTIKSDVDSTLEARNTARRLAASRSPPVPAAPPSAVATEDDEPVGLAAMGIGGKRYLRKNVSRKKTNKNSRKTRRRRNRNKSRKRR